MKLDELFAIVRRGEDSGHQFKSNFTNQVSLGQEIVAFSNSGGGLLLIGVNDDGTIAGLTRADIGRLNQSVSNAASQLVRPPVNPSTEVVSTPEGLVLLVRVPDGIGKPYMDKNGVIWVKSGADKRKATAREEVQRMFQRAGLIHGDEVPVRGLTLEDLDRDYFERFFNRHYGERVEAGSVSLASLLENMGLMTDGVFTVGGGLLFCRNVEFKLPNFMVKGMAFRGRAVDVDNYDDSEDTWGKIEDVFRQSVAFVMRNLRHVQGDKHVNSLGDPEVPRVVIEELVSNALVHRDYFVSAPIVIFVFADRIEIKSPGHLPNNLTIERMKMGLSVVRNSILTSYATKVLPYRGIGSGVRRALAEHPAIDFDNDIDGNQFVATIRLGAR